MASPLKTRLLGSGVVALLGLSCFAPSLAQVKTGLDVLVTEDFRPLRGKRVGLITNHTGLDRQGRSNVEIFLEAQGVKLAALFSPEHGFSGTLQEENIADAVYRGTKVPVYSLYGQTRRPTSEMLRGLDVLVFDIQDIGARFYTYITTLGYAMEEASRAGISVMVLDRPNPVTGTRVEGEVLKPEFRSFIGYFEVPIRHGMTVGELARFYQEQALPDLRLTVVRMEGWERGLWYDGTGLPWVPTSPNMRTLAAAALYPGLALFENVNLSVGRGTDWPFEVVGAPWLDSKKLIRELKKLEVRGIGFRRVRLLPDQEPYLGEKCQGVRFLLTDREAFEPLEFFSRLLFVLRELHGKDLRVRWDRMAQISGSRRLEEVWAGRVALEKVWEEWRRKAQKFRGERKPYLLYPEGEKAP